MSNSGFTRDEVILTLDALYSSEKQRLPANSDTLKELSDILHRLPIHDISERTKASFRTPRGIAQQINLYLRSCRLGEKSPDVGQMFFDIAFEYENRQEELHQIAEAIRKNEEYFSIEFGDAAEDIGFPEGILLGHAHHVIETKANIKIAKGEQCAICSIQPSLQYQTSDNFLELHLMVLPSKLDCKKRYNSDDFITVCPTCHAVLHRYRPWRTDKNFEDILR